VWAQVIDHPRVADAIGEIIGSEKSFIKQLTEFAVNEISDSLTIS
jgi:hypothetical protein